ncbi:MAG: hypothetical protein AABY64_00395 [Bdellovibrionota bacterium]
MKLSQLLEGNDACKSSKGIPGNFGDFYLLKNNRIYSSVRSLAIESGFQYSLDKNDAYYALPLSQLESVLEQKKIPYFDNVSVLKEIESRLKTGVFWDDISDNLKKNHVFHESCHAVIRSRASHLLTNQPQEKILKILLEESFSNTCELLAIADVNHSLHRIFFEWNSYTFLYDEKTNLKNAMNDLGETLIFKYLLFCYLHSNFLFNEFDEKTFKRVQKVVFGNAIFDSKAIKSLRALAKMAFTLDRRFREVTTGFYLRLCGFQTPLNELLDFDFMQTLEKRKDYQLMIDSVVSSLLRKNKDK